MTAVLPVEGSPAERTSAAARWQSPVLAPLAVRLRGRLRLGEIGILTILCLAGYLWVGVWMRDDLHYFINDALARSTDGVFITVGRDPHLGAIGFFWPPLPQLIQGPIVPFLDPSAGPTWPGRYPAPYAWP